MKFSRSIPALLATIVFTFAVAPAAAQAIPNPYNLGNLQNTVYYVYNPDCGGYNFWHDTYYSQLAWWCTNRLADISTLSHNSSYTTGDVVYCYTEAKVGAKHERCLESQVVWDSYQHQSIVGKLYAYWTNS